MSDTALGSWDGELKLGEGLYFGRRGEKVKEESPDRGYLKVELIDSCLCPGFRRLQGSAVIGDAQHISSVN